MLPAQDNPLSLECQARLVGFIAGARAHRPAHTEDAQTLEGICLLTLQTGDFLRERDAVERLVRKLKVEWQTN